jgi:putative SOS response-associated peptidase YedK
MQSYHERMPVILAERDFDAWLSGKAGVEVLNAAPDDVLRVWKVSKRVNVSGVGDDDATLLEPIECDRPPLTGPFGMLVQERALC